MLPPFNCKANGGFLVDENYRISSYERLSRRETEIQRENGTHSRDSGRVAGCHHGHLACLGTRANAVSTSRWTSL